METAFAARPAWHANESAWSWSSANRNIFFQEGPGGRTRSARVPRQHGFLALGPTPPSSRDGNVFAPLGRRALDFARPFQRPHHFHRQRGPAAEIPPCAAIRGFRGHHRRARHAVRQGTPRAVSQRQGHSDDQGRRSVVEELQFAQSHIKQSLVELAVMADTGCAALDTISDGNDEGKVEGTVLHAGREEAEQTRVRSAYGVPTARARRRCLLLQCQGWMGTTL